RGAGPWVAAGGAAPALAATPAAAEPAAAPAAGTPGDLATGDLAIAAMTPGRLASAPEPIGPSAAGGALWIPGTAQAWKVTYRTTTSGGQPALSTGMVYVPEGPAPEGGWPVISWAHGTTGLGDTCAPSVQGWSERDLGYLAHWMGQGYAVVAT